MYSVEICPLRNVYNFYLLKSASTISILGEEWSRFLNDFKMEFGDTVLFDMDDMDDNVELPMKIMPMDAGLETKFRIINDHPVSMEEGNCFSAI